MIQIFMPVLSIADLCLIAIVKVYNQQKQHPQNTDAALLTNTLTQCQSTYPINKVFYTNFTAFIDS